MSDAHPLRVVQEPVGLSRKEAARHVGVGTTTFDKMVRDGRMPKPVTIERRKVWIRLRIEAALYALEAAQLDAESAKLEESDEWNSDA